MSHEFKKLTHTVYQCKYHIVFCPKYRYRILIGEKASYVYREIYRLCEQKDGVEVLEANVQADHVHLIVSIAPKYAVSNIMGYLKGKLRCAFLINTLKSRNDYGVASYGHEAIVSALSALTRTRSANMSDGRSSGINIKKVNKSVCSIS